jgi:hypothetical protein
MRLTKNKIIFTIVFAFFLHLLTLQFDTTPPPKNIQDYEVNLWLPAHLITSIILPIGLLLTLIFLPKSKFSKFMTKAGKKIKVLVLIFGGFYLIWLVGFNLLSNSTRSFDKANDKAGADSVVLYSIKNNEILKAAIGEIDSTFNYNTEISSFSAKYRTLVHSNGKTIHVEVLLSRSNNWNVDTIIMK